MVYLIRICQQVSGMPLGLELAASWVDILSVEEVAGEIQKSIDFLETDAQDLPGRHRSLQAICDSTWERLDQVEQDIFARLSIFRGGFTREAAQEVIGASLRTLASLHNKSLLGYDPANKRYYIHPYLRHYGVEQLASNPEEEFDIRDRHSAYFCEVVESYMKNSCNRLELNITDPMNIDITNIKSAWDWIIDHEEVFRIKQVFGGLVVYFDWFYGYGDILKICNEAIDVFKEIDNRMELEEVSIIDPWVLELAHTKTQIVYGVYVYDYDKNRSIQLFHQSNEKLNQLADAGHDVRAEKAHLRRCQAIRCENYEESMALFIESITLSKEINDDWGMIESCSFAGDKALWSGNPEEAIIWFERALSSAIDKKDYLYEITNLGRLGEAYGSWLASYDEAIPYYKNAISKACAINNDRLKEFTLREYGGFLISRGKFEEARDSLEQAIRISELSGLLMKSLSLRNLADVYWLTGQFEEAETALCESIDFQVDTRLPPEASPMAVYCQFLALTGRYDEALKGLNPDNRFSKDLIRDDFVICVQSRVQCWVDLVKDRYVEAKSRSFFRIDKARSLSYKQWVAESQADIAIAEYGLSNLVEAKNILSEALTTTIEFQGYYQLVFTLPITLLILMDENLELATEVYKIVKRDPFLGRAQLYIDLVYQHLPDEITSVQVETVKTSPEHRKGLWAAAKKVLVSWQDETPKAL
jgi:tetratricopeptide (TPR) repeat protein